VADKHRKGARKGHGERRPQPGRPDDDHRADKDHRAEAVTVGWMLTTVATAAAELAGLVVFLLIRFASAGGAFPEPLRLFPSLMLFTALILGLVSLVLTPLVYHFRQTPPPISVTLVSATLAILPVLVLAIAAVA